MFAAREITERKHQDMLLHSMDFRDPLTQVLNRRGMMDRLHMEMRAADAQSASVALLYLDLDSFKPINDRWGHEAGDELLIQLTQRIQSALRANDSLARLGGDEFVVLLPQAKREEALTIARRLCQSLNATWVLNAESVVASAPIGLAFYPMDGRTADEVLRCADKALYEAKAPGRACVRSSKTAKIRLTLMLSQCTKSNKSLYFLQDSIQIERFSEDLDEQIRSCISKVCLRPTHEYHRHAHMLFKRSH